ncbi:unannotated protein [freshwater metagenome]|uniref:Unannotated protein n=1 Tax=freshwater metagenome TaxID=449393 RepID=A0A6J7XPZ9_9ZZZZ|nr:hypothetical protein [Actinomycetota bacterium]
MSIHLIAFLVVFLCNVVPAFAPPTWTVLVFFTLNYHIHALGLIPIAITAAVMGRAILAYSFRHFSIYLPKGYVRNMENASTHISASKKSFLGLLALFLFAPLSSAQLFEAAGIMKKIDLKPLLAVFALGRLFSYSFYITGASAVKASSLGEAIIEQMQSTEAIVVQILTILGLVALGNVKWRPKR